MRYRVTRAITVLFACSTFGLAACGNGGGGSDRDSTTARSGSAQAAAGPTFHVAAAFYPLAYLAERIGGPAARVKNLTSPGAEPHDLELSPKQVASLADDDLVLYIKGFQPAVDAAIAQQAQDAALDVNTVTASATGVPVADGRTNHKELADDPHLWLDPLRFASVGDAVAARLAVLQPTLGPTFTANASALRADLVALDADYRSGLATCARRDIVTSHDAYGHLARAFGLEQVPLTGLTPEEDASPATLARVAKYAADKGVTTIFFEELVSPKVARSLADEVGAEAVELSPLEGAPETGDYLTQMRANLTTLQRALGCSTP